LTPPNPPEPETAEPTGRDLVYGTLILALLVALFHGSALTGGFVYDDHWTIVDNDFLQSPANLTRLLSAAPARAGVPDAGRPTLLASELLDRALWGLAPLGHHLQSLLWHLAIAALFFVALARLTRDPPLALLSAALFAVQPLGVEAVAAINYREDLLATFFTLASLCAIARQGRGWGARVVAFSLLVIGGFAKESAVVAPIVLVMLELFRPTADRRGRVVDFAVLTAAALIPVLWRAWAIGGLAVVSRTAEIPADHADPLGALPQAAGSFLCGLGQLVFPWHLAADYPDPPLAHAALGWAALAVIIAGTLLALRVRREHRWFTFGVTAAVAAYLPTFGFAPLSNLRADRYFYGALLPLSLALASALLATLSRISWLRARTFELPRAWLLLGALLVVLGVRTRHQVRVWHDDLTLWSHATTAQPGASRAWSLLAEARLRRGLLPAARAAAERSLALADDPHVRELHGIVLMESGDLAAAHAELTRALSAAEPHHRAEWLNNLGECELRLDQVDAALRRFAEARRLSPSYRAPWLNAARALERKGDREGARQLRERAPSRTTAAD
jgi:tetratricopeptide (TPR) repeat protein